MLFYILVPIIFLAIVGVFCLVKYLAFKDDEKFDKVMSKMLKVLVCTYCSLQLLSILLPDSFAISLSKETAGSGLMQGMAVLRWFASVAFVALPIAVFYKNRTIRNIAIYFCMAVSIAQIACYGDYISEFTGAAGRGLNSLPVSDGFKQFLLNPTFRGIWFGIIMVLQMVIPVVLAIQEKHVFNVKDGKEWGYFFLCLPFLIISVIPTYVPQYLFGYSDVVFGRYSWLHFAWVAFIVVEIVVLYFIFRKKSKDDKMVMLFVLALSLMMQYNSLFGIISLNIKRAPLQLCNIGAYLVLISLITKNKKIFNFTVIINVVGVILAVAVPDLEGKGFFYLYNMHFILEHTNVLVVPVLALLLKIFPRLDKYALRDCIVGFTIYFVSVWVLGTVFNAIALKTGNSFWSANYMFMFDVKAAKGMLPFTEALFNINFKIGYGTFYPVIFFIVYVVFALICVGLYFAIRLIYLIKDKIVAKKVAIAVVNDTEQSSVVEFDNLANAPSEVEEANKGETNSET